MPRLTADATTYVYYVAWCTALLVWVIEGDRAHLDRALQSSVGHHEQALRSTFSVQTVACCTHLDRLPRQSIGQRAGIIKRSVKDKSGYSVAQHIVPLQAPLQVLLLHRNISEGFPLAHTAR
jgi:hypothetical protein